MKWMKEQYLVAAILTIIVLVYGILALLSGGTYGGADDVSHYQYARYAFENPAFFFNWWAKPFFTAITAPFAQLGPNGIRIFNVLIGTATAYFTYRTARALKLRDPVLAIFLLLSSPMYTVLMLSGMTEILFSFMLILSIFLFYRRKYGWAAVILSFIPFVRTEGMVILPFFLIAFVIQRSWKSLPLLLFGTVFYSIAGNHYYNDLLWVIHSMPYTGNASDIYGSGSLFHYARASKFIFGIPVTLLIPVGLLVWASVPWWDRKRTRKSWMLEMLVVYMPFFAYFAAHSYVWWKGEGNSVGLIRVIVAILPSAVLLALLGWSRLMALVPVKALYKRIVAIVFALFLVIQPHRVYTIPVPLQSTQKHVKAASDWLMNSPYYQNKIYYFDPFFAHFLHLNPFDREQSRRMLPDREHPENRISQGEIVIWDAHFGPNEGHVPLEKLMNSSGFRLIHIEQPERPFTVLGGYNYEIYIFQRITEDDGISNEALREQLIQ